MKLIKFNVFKYSGKTFKAGNVPFEIKTYKTVGIFKYLKFKKNGWILDSIEIFIFSDIYNFLSELNTTNKISVIAIIVAVVIFLVDKFYF